MTSTASQTISNSDDVQRVTVHRGFQVQMCSENLARAHRHARAYDWAAARAALCEALGLAKSLGKRRLVGTILTALRRTKRVVS